ncbi:hypothetical protein EBR43_04675 [bacterium]|nr:hypothetical protein [bacterium]
MLMPKKLLVGITFFHYSDEKRYTILREISNNLNEVCNDIIIAIITLPIDEIVKNKIVECFDKNFSVKIFERKLDSHPHWLTWEHLKVFKEFYEKDKTISHFLYLEDDHVLTKLNINYWVESREELKNIGLIPSFLRYEKKINDDNLYITDITSPLNLDNLNRVIASKDYGYFNVPTKQLAYQGVYLLDRELAQEHFYSTSFDPGLHHNIWGIREGATQGVTFLNVPKGFITRNVLKFNIEKKIIDKAVLIHHAPNNYANDPNSHHGKLPYTKLLA